MNGSHRYGVLPGPLRQGRAIGVAIPRARDPDRYPLRDHTTETCI